MEATNIPQSQEIVYTGTTLTTGGREGTSKSSDGRLDIKLTPPGAVGTGTNPEQLFGAGWSACFIGAMGFVATGMKVKLPNDTSVRTDIDLCVTDGQYSLQAHLGISLPGIDPEIAKAIANAAHQMCPYSKATRGNINVDLKIL